MSFLSGIGKKLSGGEGGDDRRNLTFNNDPFDFRISDEKDVKITGKIDTLADVDVKYPLIKPFAYAHVKWNEEEKELRYKVKEPELNEGEEELFDQIKEALSEKLDVSLSSVQDREKVIEYLEDKINDVLLELGINLTKEQHNKIMYFIYRDFVGLGKIEPFMHDPYIEDLGADGVGVPIFAVHSEFGSVKSDVVFNEKQDLKNLVVKLAERCGRYVSYANPLLDGALPDGSRVNATLTEDVTSKGPTFSIRKFKTDPFSAINMMDLGTSNAEIMAYMWLLMQYQQSILIIGGTATGKTSFLNSIVSFIPPEDKIVSIEDTRELRLPHENWIPSVTRSMFGQSGQSDVDMDQLLKESFRENPDYVIVGEVRGEEASVLFQGMASGHPSIGTMHASGPNDVVKRLVTPPINLSPALLESLDAIVVMTHAKGVEKSARRVRSVQEVQTVMVQSESARTNEAFSWTARDDTHSRHGEPFLFNQISSDYGISKAELQTELENRSKVLAWLKEKGVKDFEKVSRIIAEYYKNQEKVLKMVNAEESDYTLQDIIDAESRIDISRPPQLDNAMKQEKEQEVRDRQKRETALDKSEEDSRTDELKREIQQLKDRVREISGDTPIDEKKKLEENPVAELEKQLKAEREKVNKFGDSHDENPFDTEEEKAAENPFEA